MFVIRNSRTGEYAGFNFPAKTVAEYPDAKKFETRRSAEAALKGAIQHAGGLDALSHFVGFEVEEV